MDQQILDYLDNSEKQSQALEDQFAKKLGIPDGFEYEIEYLFEDENDEDGSELVWDYCSRTFKDRKTKADITVSGVWNYGDYKKPVLMHPIEANDQVKTTELFTTLIHPDVADKFWAMYVFKTKNKYVPQPEKPMKSAAKKRTRRSKAPVSTGNIVADSAKVFSTINQ